MNKNVLNMLTIAHDLQAQGKEPIVKVLPSAVKRPRKMMLRGQKTTELIFIRGAYHTDK